MKKILLPIFALLSFGSAVNAQVLYSNSTLVGNVYNPGLTQQGNPKVVFDDVNIASSAVAGSDSISITKVNFGIYRPANAVATTVNFYYTPYEDTSTRYNTFIKIPPRIIGTVNLPVGGASATQTTISFGDSVNALFKIKTDTGNVYTGYNTFFLGVGFSTTNGAYWRFASGGPNDDVMWIYNADSTVQRFASYFGGSPRAGFAAEVFGFPSSALPVTLSVFKAAFANNNVQLNWNTESESNSSHFDVEVSKDGIDFFNIGKVKAAGSAASTKAYNFVHTKPTAGTYYYRLKMVDKDGTFQYSTVQKVTVTGVKQLELVVTPNPVVGLIQFNWLETGLYKYALNSVAGKVVQAGTVQQGVNKFDVGNLASGVYIMNIIDESGKVIATQKLVKQ